MWLRDVEAEALQLLTGVWHWVSTELHLSDVGMCGQVLKRTLKSEMDLETALEISGP